MSAPPSDGPLPPTPSPPPGVAPPDPLAALRAGLDAVDHSLMDLVARRRELVARLFDWKRSHGLPLIDPEREAALRAERTAHAVAQGVPIPLAQALVQLLLDDSHAVAQVAPAADPAAASRTG